MFTFYIYIGLICFFVVFVLFFCYLCFLFVFFTRGPVLRFRRHPLRCRGGIPWSLGFGPSSMGTEDTHLKASKGLVPLFPIRASYNEPVTWSTPSLMLLMSGPAYDGTLQLGNIFNSYTRQDTCINMHTFHSQLRKPHDYIWRIMIGCTIKRKRRSCLLSRHNDCSLVTGIRHWSV